MCVWESVSTYLISVRAITPAERLILRGNVSRKVGCGLGGQRCRYIKKIGVKAAPICMLLFFNPLVTQHQIYQVFFFPARVDGDIMEQQVLPQVPDSQAHEPWPLKCCCLQQMTCGTNGEIFLQQGAHSAEGPFTVTANILSNKEWEKRQLRICGILVDIGLELLVNSDTVYMQTRLTSYFIMTQWKAYKHCSIWVNYMFLDKNSSGRYFI